MSLVQPELTEQEDTALEHRTVVVTGASRGIGRGIAEQLGTHGASVAVNYRSSSAEAEEVADIVDRAGGEAVTVQGDVADAEAMQEMATAVRDTFGSVDVLVNNAGITADGTFENMSAEDWQRVIDVNLTGVFNTTKAFYDDVKEAPEGRIINVSSLIGEQGNFGQCNYAAAKAGLHGFTRSLAKELAPAGTTVNCVAPGFTETDMLADVPEKVRESLLDDIPLSRFGQVEDVASMVRFLASPDSSYVTGQVLSVSGGQNL
ncbi:MAG: 3-oxoacyl-[acyl-carrier-protein] reductase [Haloarculaceae archaeon]